jgi:hypothetical protein
MLGLIANFMGDLGKQLIAVGVARSRSKAFANPFVAVAAGVACRFYLIFSNTKSRTKKHKLSPMVESWSSYYGDKILARVNSGELVLNSDQQSKLYGQMNSRW